MQYIRSYFTPSDEPPPVYVGYLGPIPINTLLQEAKEVTAPGNIQYLIDTLNMIYYDYAVIKLNILFDSLAKIGLVIKSP